MSPLVAVISGELREKAIEIHQKAEQTGDECDAAYRDGFFDALRQIFSSETIGMLIMDCDAVEDEERFTDTLPRLVMK